MESRKLGSSDTRIARIGLGTWRLRDAGRSRTAIAAGVEAGLTHVDTAELYEQQTGSESLLGQMFRDDPGMRDRVFLASKVLPHNASFDGTLAACEASLARLGTDHLDLYYLHWRGEHPLEETLDALATLVEDGKVRHIGVSNFDVDDLEEAEHHLGRGVLAANQVLYHLEDRGAEHEVLPWCRRHGVTLVAYSPFGGGSFVPDRRRRKVLDEVAAERGLDARQAALAFLTRDDATVAIPKTEDAMHAKALAGADVDLPRSAVAELEAAFPLQPGLRHL